GHRRGPGAGERDQVRGILRARAGEEHAQGAGALWRAEAAAALSAQWNECRFFLGPHGGALRGGLPAAEGPVMKPSYLLLMVVMNALWAASLSMYKALGDYLEPGGVVTLRFGLAAVSLLVCWPWLPGKAPRGRDLA